MESSILINSLFNNFKRYKEILVILISFIIGFSVSSGLLFFNGKELVNALIYMGVVVVIPFFFSLISAIRLIFVKSKLEVEGFKISFLSGVFFSVGALISLLFIVTTSDIAFGWATTLNIKPQILANSLNTLALWQPICNSCIISEHLAQISQFNRLGGAVTKEQITLAKELGSWWRYLALLILVYGVIFRAILYTIATFIFRENKINFTSEKNQEILEPISENYQNKINSNLLENREFKLIGYYLDIDNLNLKSNSNAKDIVVAIKSWEPPILDFFDYLEELQEENRGSKISIYLVGLNGKAKDEDVKIWQRKLNELKLNYEVIV